MAMKTIVLITGANSGIGFELTAQLMAKGTYHVLLGARSPSKGHSAVQELQSRNLPGTVELLPIDVTDDSTINAAVTSVQSKHGHLDILVNNAAVAAMDPPLRQQMRDAFDTNTTGPAVVTETFATLLKASTSPLKRIINVSSGAGSITYRLDPSKPMYNSQDLQYRASKAALSMVTACQWVEYGPLGIKVFAYCPGFTASNLSSRNKIENGARAVEDSVKPLVDVLEGRRDEDVGKFLNKDGIYPW